MEEEMLQKMYPPGSEGLGLDSRDLRNQVPSLQAASRKKERRAFRESICSNDLVRTVPASILTTSLSSAPH